MTPIARFVSALALVIAASIGSPGICVAADTPVTLRDGGEMKHATVRLSDLFNGIPADRDEDIAQAPLPGKQAVYDQSLLTKLATKYDLSWKPQGSGAHIVLTTPSTRITAEAIHDAVVQKVKESGAKGEADVAFDNRALAIDLPADQTNDFTLNNFEYDPLSKRFRADLVAESGQGPFAMPLTGRITMKQHVPVLAKKLEGGTILGSSDIDWIDAPDERVNESVVTEAEQLIGRELRHTTPPGELLHTNDVLPARLVTRGSLITMKIETSFMALTAQGKALQDGAMGEVVRVINTQSNRMIEGTVDGPGTVVIHTAQKLAEAK